MRHLLDTFAVSAKIPKVQLRTAFMLSQLVSTCSQNSKFDILTKGADNELIKSLERTVLNMLQSSNTNGIMTSGVTVASAISDQASDSVFLAQMRLFNIAKTTPDLRKRIIRGLKAPISEPALAFLGKRLRD